MAGSRNEYRRSIDIFEALRQIRIHQETAARSESNLPLVAHAGWPVSIPASALGNFELPGVPGEWRISGTITPTSLSTQTWTLPSPTLAHDKSFGSNEVTNSSRPSHSSPPPSQTKDRFERQVFFSELHVIAFIINVCLAQLFSLAALAQTVAPLPIIADYFNNHDPGQLSWFTAAFSLTVGTFILPAGRLGDMYGHKRIFMIGWAWFATWSLICGFSNSSIMLSACRAVQGIGPALLVPNAMALVGRTFPIGMKRNLVFSLFGACGPTGWVLGAVFSSLCAQLGEGKLPRSGWSWSFFFLALACLITFFVSYFIIPSPDSPPTTPAEILSTDATNTTIPPPSPPKPAFDFLGSFTGVTGLILVNFAFNQAPLVTWSTPYTYWLLIIGIGFFGFFIYVELNVAQHPLIPLRGLKREAGFVLACIAAGWGSHGIWVYYLYLFIENLRGYSALAACAQTWPVALTGTCAALSVGFLLKKMKVAYVMLLAMTCFAVGGILLATAPVDQSYWAQTLLSIVIMPGGMNLSFPAGIILLSNALPREHQGIAASLISTMVNYSISTGLGIAGTVAANVDPKGKDVLAGFRGAWYFAIGLSGMGCVIAGYFVWKTR
ncbi:MFS general substrate transporter [Lepidopterella palustris CBS 459.81]|uniref:MFS general substrate transporter n=1 Tax=Lepidopterella palustris CBS 459.81 TaxID=1314670 RepID=A0A8E2E4G2_9PEZI|nr:MFS general substrate transporter [Lepidopterella palustris CBS 459.81]